MGSSTIDPMNDVPVRWHAGQVEALAEVYGWANAINDHGQITGAVWATHVFLWDHGTFTDLGPMGSDFGAQPTDINRRAAIVGTGGTSGFLWSGGKVTILTGINGWPAAAAAINNHGQVAGSSATNPSGLNPTAVLWTR